MQDEIAILKRIDLSKDNSNDRVTEILGKCYGITIDSIEIITKGFEDANLKFIQVLKHIV